MSKKIIALCLALVMVLSMTACSAPAQTAEPEQTAEPATKAIRAMRSAVRISRGVQVGDLNMTVSERMAAAIMPASLAEGISPRS